MSAIVVIPARYGSTRFPGKALATETGRPLIQHVYERAARATRTSRTVVATDDERIAEAVGAFGGECVMTRSDHPNGTSRITEALERLDDGSDVVVNVQGDEPEIDPAVIDLAIAALERAADCDAATVACPFGCDDDPADPNVVKVVRDREGRALYFSRSLIPFDRDGRGEAPPLRHVGLYAYRRDFLLAYVSLAPTPLERAEQLEQLRILEHGRRIAVAVTSDSATGRGVDTPEQYRAFVERWRRANA